MSISLIYEDDTLLVVNKPAGMVVNNAATVKGETVQDWAYKYFLMTNYSNLTNLPNLSNSERDFYQRSGIVHRIDKETSGILIIAKTPDGFSKLQEEFKDRVVKKTYLALVHGILKPSEGIINAPVGRLPWNRERFGVVPGGKEAVTKYIVINSFCLSEIEGSHLSLVEVYPETGRTHQIRVHFKYINHPIVGDYLYAGRKTSRKDRIHVGRVMLHAWKINFRHPQSGKNVALEAPLPDDMKKIIKEQK